MHSIHHTSSAPLLDGNDTAAVAASHVGGPYSAGVRARVRLMTVARTAGLHLSPQESGDASGGGRVLLGEADEVAVRALAELIVAARHSTPVPVVAPVSGSAAHRLRETARAVGLELNPGTPRTGVDGPRYPLGDADHATVSRLADLITTGHTRLHLAADDLRFALVAHGLNAEQVNVDAGTVVFGAIDVPDVGTLLRLLTGETGNGPDYSDDPQGCEALAARITDAVKTVTGGGDVDAAYTPYCPRCREEAAILLHGLPLPYIARLTDHLTRTAA
ncbi:MULTISPECIES: hypothetical protein [unclassified Streptomyces]|uniref:hypothetical protein n=1 Tax=unclassified Streptomyces TaxID=2593676 RepID=UPI002E2D0B87|nr:hypothetical protein [Streptomyces sp. NBC_00223]